MKVEIKNKTENIGFRDALRSDRFLITMDTIPPKGTDISGVLKTMSSLKGRGVAKGDRILWFEMLKFTIIVENPLYMGLIEG